MRHFALAFPLASALLLGMLACAPRGPRLPPVESGAGGGRIVSDLLAAQPCPASLASDLDLFLRLPGESPVRMSGGLRVAWPDRLRLQARVGAFWPVASIAVRADSSFLSLPRLKRYWAGDHLSSLGTDPAALASTLLWLLCPGPLAAALDEPSLERDGKGWVLTGRIREIESNLVCELYLPKDEAEITEIVFRDSSGEIQLHAWRLGRKEVDGGSIPETVRLQVGLPAVRFETRLLNPRSDESASPETFRIPQPVGFRTIPEGELLDLFQEAGRGR